MSNDYKTRVALHGSIPTEDIPGEISTTDEDGDASIVEILYDREEAHYRALSRHYRTLYLDHFRNTYNSFDAALDAAIDLARTEDLPILKTVYTWAPASTGADELGADRIHLPWNPSDDEG